MTENSTTDCHLADPEQQRVASAKLARPLAKPSHILDLAANHATLLFSGQVHGGNFAGAQSEDPDQNQRFRTRHGIETPAGNTHMAMASAAKVVAASLSSAPPSLRTLRSHAATPPWPNPRRMDHAGDSLEEAADMVSQAGRISLGRKSHDGGQVCR